VGVVETVEIGGEIAQIVCNIVGFQALGSKVLPFLTKTTQSPKLTSSSRWLKS
jgi:hypothetical protein